MSVPNMEPYIRAFYNAMAAQEKILHGPVARAKELQDLVSGLPLSMQELGRLADATLGYGKGLSQPEPEKREVKPFPSRALQNWGIGSAPLIEW